MKSYNVTLSNKQCIFDQRDNIETAEEAVAFASGRGSSYLVYIDAGKGENGECIKATHHTSTNTFAVDDGWDCIYLAPAQFADYLRKNL